MEIKEFYENQILFNLVKRSDALNKSRLLAMSRLFVFLLIAASIYFFPGTFIMWGSLFVGIPVFLFLVKLSADVSIVRKRADFILLINHRELKALEGDWSDFKDGSSFKDSAHPFSQDMDLFGKRSLFQLVNRTVTKRGEAMLAEHLKDGVKDPMFTNKMITELEQHPEWCQEFLAEAMMVQEEDKEEDLKNFESIEGTFSQFELVLMYMLPVLAIVSTILFSIDLINVSIFTGVILFNLTIAGMRLKKTNKISFAVGRYDKTVSVAVKRMSLLDELEVCDPDIKKWKQSRFGNKGELKKSLETVQKVQDHMNYRLNIFVGLLLNFYLAWDIRVVYEWHLWKKNFGKSVDEVDSQFAKIEFWISGAVYKQNHQGLTYAEFSDEKIELIGMGHPFIPTSDQITNELSFSSEERIQIITGPNMAGKSTYLRSVGWVIISANCGFPVMAEKCLIPSLKLYTSMRNSDDLSGSSSFFHAELSRLRFIVDAIEQGEQVFVILDEILKGTNSKDKEEGSLAFLKKLARMGAKGIIATHDLALCQLEDTSGKFRNRYFDSTIKDGDLFFDYKIRDGVCQNMNASFLLQRMGLVD